MRNRWRALKFGTPIAMKGDVGVGRKKLPKILIHDMSMRGDMLMSSPCYKSFKDAGWDTHSLCYDFCEEILQGNPYIDRIWTAKSQLSAWKLIPKLRKEQFSYVTQLNTSFKTNLFLSLLGSTSIAFSYKWKGLPLDIKIKTRHSSCAHGNRIEEIGELIFRAFGLNIEPKMIYRPGLPVYPEWKNTIVIHRQTGRHFRERMWDKWEELIRRLPKKYPLFFMDSARSSIRTSAIILKSCKLLITVNSFPLHLGISQGTPTLALVGRTPKEVIVHPSVEKFWYLQDPAIFDHSLKPMNFSVEEVLEKVKEALNEK